VNQEGKQYYPRFSQTYLGCHSNREKFCDPCPTCEGVKPICRDWHVVPKERGT